MALRADLVGSEYIFTWDTSGYSDGSANPHVRLRQSTFFGGPLALEKVRKRAGGYTPILNPDGDIDAAILRAMTGQCSVNEIVTHVLEQFPGRFPSRSDALTRVSDLSERYSR